MLRDNPGRCFIYFLAFSPFTLLKYFFLFDTEVRSYWKVIYFWSITMWTYGSLHKKICKLIFAQNVLKHNYFSKLSTYSLHFKSSLDVWLMNLYKFNDLVRMLFYNVEKLAIENIFVLIENNLLLLKIYISKIKAKIKM